MYRNPFYPICILLTATVWLVSACSSDKPKEAAAAQNKPKAMQVDAFVVRHIPVSDNIELPGTIIASETTEIHPEISGRLTYLNIPEGKTISKGTLIAKIYDGDLQAELNKLKVQLSQAEQTTKRYEELLKIDGVSKQEYDLQKLQISNIKADMAIVSSNILRTQIRAPFTGTLGLKNVSQGAYVTPASVLTSIRKISSLKVDFSVPESYIGKMATGQIVNFKTDGNPKVYNARIDASEMGISEENRSLNVRASITNADNNILPGAFVKVTTNFPADPHAIMIPSQAIVSQARGKQVVLFDGGEAKFQDVKAGIRDSAMVQITEGLSVSDTVITTGLMSLKEGTKIELNTLDKPE